MSQLKANALSSLRLCGLNSSRQNQVKIMFVIQQHGEKRTRPETLSFTKEFQINNRDLESRLRQTANVRFALIFS